MEKLWTSWNDRLKHGYTKLYEVCCHEDIVEAVRESTTLRVIGTGRSSADICAGTTNLLSMEKYTKVLAWDDKKLRVTVQAGIILRDLLTEITKRGWEIAALPDLDVITLGGAISTGTHGTGREALSLSSYVCGLTVVLADGSTLTLDESKPDELDAFRISLGVLGIISSITVQCAPMRTLKILERPVRDKDWIPSYEQLLAQHDFTRLLWLPHTGRAVLITSDTAASIPSKAAPKWHSKRRAMSQFFYRKLAKLPYLRSLANRILYHLFFSSTVVKEGNLYDATVTKSRGAGKGTTMVLAEWTIPLSRFPQLMADLQAALEPNLGVHIPMDVRFIRKESAWLSNACEGDTVTLGCVCRDPENADDYQAFRVIEPIFLKHRGRPHWAKHFKAGPAELAPLYPRWQDFCDLRKRLDPEGKFLNEYLRGMFFQ